MPLNAHTAPFENRKKRIEQGTIVATTGTMPRQRRVAMPATAGMAMAAKPTA